MDNHRDAVAFLRRKLQLQMNGTLSLQRIFAYMSEAKFTILKTFGSNCNEVAKFVRSHPQIFSVSDDGAVSLCWTLETEAMHLLIDILATNGGMDVSNLYEFFITQAPIAIRKAVCSNLEALTSFIKHHPMLFDISSGSFVECITNVLLDGVSGYSSDNFHVIIISVINLFLVYGLYDARIEDVKKELFKKVDQQGADFATCNNLEAILPNCPFFDVDGKGHVKFKLKNLTPELLLEIYIKAVLSNESNITVHELLARITPFHLTKDLQLHTIGGLTKFLETRMCLNIDGTLHLGDCLHFEALHYVYSIVNGKTVPIETLTNPLSNAPIRVQCLIGKELTAIIGFLQRNAHMFQITEDRYVHAITMVCDVQSVPCGSSTNIVTNDSSVNSNNSDKTKAVFKGYVKMVSPSYGLIIVSDGRFRNNEVYFDNQKCTFMKKGDNITKWVTEGHVLSFELSDGTAMSNYRMNAYNVKQVTYTELPTKHSSVGAAAIPTDIATTVLGIRTEKQSQCDAAISNSQKDENLLSAHLNVLKRVAVLLLQNGNMTIDKLHEAVEEAALSLFMTEFDFEKFLAHYGICSFDEKKVALKAVLGEGCISQISSNAVFIHENKDVFYSISAIYNPLEVQEIKEGTLVKYIAVSVSLLPVKIDPIAPFRGLLVWSTNGPCQTHGEHRENMYESSISIQDEHMVNPVKNAQALSFLIETVRCRKGVPIQALTGYLSQAPTDVQGYLKGLTKITSFLKTHGDIFAVNENGSVSLQSSFEATEPYQHARRLINDLNDNYEAELKIIKQVVLLLLTDEELSFSAILSTLREMISGQMEELLSKDALVQLLSKYAIFELGKTSVCLKATPAEGHITVLNDDFAIIYNTSNKQKVYYQESAVHIPPKTHITNELDYNLKINSRVKYIAIRHNSVSKAIPMMRAILVWPSEGANLMKLASQIARHSMSKKVCLEENVSLIKRHPPPIVTVKSTQSAEKEITYQSLSDCNKMSAPACARTHPVANIIDSATKDPIIDLALLIALHVKMLCQTDQMNSKEYFALNYFNLSQIFADQVVCAKYVKLHPSALQLSDDALKVSSANIPVQSSIWCRQNAEITYLTHNSALAEGTNGRIYIQRKTVFCCEKQDLMSRVPQQHQLKSVLKLGDKVTCLVVPYRKSGTATPLGTDLSTWQTVLMWHSSYNNSLGSALSKLTLCNISQLPPTTPEFVQGANIANETQLRGTSHQSENPTLILTTVNTVKTATESPMVDLIVLIAIFVKILKQTGCSHLDCAGFLAQHPFINSSIFRDEEVCKSYVKLHPSMLKVADDGLKISSTNLPQHTSSWCILDAIVTSVTPNAALAEASNGAIYILRKTFFDCGKMVLKNREPQQGKMKSVLNVGSQVSCLAVQYQIPTTTATLPGAELSKWQAALTWHSFYNISLQQTLSEITVSAQSIFDTPITSDSVQDGMSSVDTQVQETSLHITTPETYELSQSESKHPSTIMTLREDIVLLSDTKIEMQPRPEDDINLTVIITLLEEAIQNNGISLRDAMECLHKYKNSSHHLSITLSSVESFHAYILKHSYIFQVHEGALIPACEYTQDDIVIKAPGTITKIESGQIFLTSIVVPEMKVLPCPEVIMYPLHSTHHGIRVGDHIQFIAASQSGSMPSWKVLFAWYSNKIEKARDAQIICLHHPLKAQMVDHCTTADMLANSNAEVIPLGANETDDVKSLSKENHMQNAACFVENKAPEGTLNGEDIVPSIVAHSNSLTDITETIVTWMTDLDISAKNSEVTPHEWWLAQAAEMKTVMGHLLSAQHQLTDKTYEFQNLGQNVGGKSDQFVQGWLDQCLNQPLACTTNTEVDESSSFATCCSHSEADMVDENICICDSLPENIEKALYVGEDQPHLPQAMDGNAIQHAGLSVDIQQSSDDLETEKKITQQQIVGSLSKTSEHQTTASKDSYIRGPDSMEATEELIECRDSQIFGIEVGISSINGDGKRCTQGSGVNTWCKENSHSSSKLVVDPQINLQLPATLLGGDQCHSKKADTCDEHCQTEQLPLVNNTSQTLSTGGMVMSSQSNSNIILASQVIVDHIPDINLQLPETLSVEDHCPYKKVHFCDKYCQTDPPPHVNNTSQTLSTGGIVMCRYVHC